jgi:hypothetical protein
MTFPQRFALIVCAVALVLIPATGAHAAPASRHCVVGVTPGATLTCYSSFATALSNATGGRVTDAPDDARAALGDERLAAKLNALGNATTTASATAVQDIVISIEYSSTGQSGSSLIVTAPHGCDDFLDPVEFVMTSMPSGWNDEIESFQAFANCAALHWLHNGASADFGPGDDAFYFWRNVFPSWLSDEISSISWT